MQPVIDEEEISLVADIGVNSSTMETNLQLLVKKLDFYNSTPDPNADREDFKAMPAAREPLEIDVFENEPLPMVDISLIAGARSNRCVEVKALIDSGS